MILSVIKNRKKRERVCVCVHVCTCVCMCVHVPVSVWCWVRVGMQVKGQVYLFFAPHAHVPDVLQARAKRVVLAYISMVLLKACCADGVMLSTSSRMTILCRPGGSFTFFRENILMLFRTTSIPLQIGREGGGASTVMHNQSQQANETHCDSQKQHKATQSNTNKIKTSSLTDHLMHSFP